MRNISIVAIGLTLSLTTLPVAAGVNQPLAPVDASGTIASTGVYQTVFSQDLNRQGCLIQNRLANTNAMTVRVNGTTIYDINPGASFSCAAIGVVVSSKIEITGTATQAFSAAAE